MLRLTANVKHQDAGYVRRLGQVWGRHHGQDVKSKPLGAEVPARCSTACFTGNSTQEQQQSLQVYDGRSQPYGTRHLKHSQQPPRVASRAVRVFPPCLTSPSTPSAPSSSWISSLPRQATHSSPWCSFSFHQPRQCRHKSSSANYLPPTISYPPSFPSSPLPSSSPPGGTTFVSKYYRIEAGDVIEFLHRKDLTFRETASHFILKECPFCHRPTRDQADNLWKLYVSKDGAAWFCHRCGAKGSWFDFKRGLSGSGAGCLNPLSSRDGAGAEATWGGYPEPLGGGGPEGGMEVGMEGGRAYEQTRGAQGGGRQGEALGSLVTSTSVARRPAPAPPSAPPSPSRMSPSELGQRLREYQYALMDDPSHRHVRDWLTGKAPGQRGLTPTVLRKYGVGCGTFSFMNDQNVFEPTECVVFPWMLPLPGKSPPGTPSLPASPPSSAPTWVPRRCKVRAMKQKAWQRLYPSPSAGWGLFGLHTVGADAKEIILTEGEFDAMAVYQATRRAAVSLPNGCRSLPVEVLPLLERFERILLWMDNDTPGIEGAEKFANKLGARRTFIVRALPEDLDPPKDANDALLRNLNLERMIQNAQRLPDTRVIRFSDLRPLVFDELRNRDKHEGVSAKSFPGLMALLKGFRKGEMTVLTGPTGAGKTTFLSQLSLDLARGGMNTLWGSFEVQNVKLIEKMMRQYHAAPLPMGDLKSLDAVADRFGQLPLMFMRFHGSSNVEEVVDAMEYCAYVHDTELVVLDNLQFMMAMGSREGGMGGGKGGFDRFYQMDVAVEKFRRFATEKNIHVILVVHPRKESDQFRLGISSFSGTAKATQDADNVVILQRHQGRHYLDVRKNRYDGDLGVVPLAFQKQTGTLVEVEDNGLGLSLERESMYGGGGWKSMGGGGGGDRPVVREKTSH